MSSAFFYGTLLHPLVLKRVIGHHGPHLSACPAILYGHRRHRVKLCDYPAVIPSSQSRSMFPISDPSDLGEDSVRGTLVHGLSPEDIDLLDTFEGDEYTRKIVTVHPLAEPTAFTDALLSASIPSTSSSSPSSPSSFPPTEASIYVWTAPLTDLDPEPWSFETFIRDCAHKWVPVAEPVGASGPDPDSASDNPTVVAESEYAEVDKRRQMMGVIVRPDSGTATPTTVENDHETIAPNEAVRVLLTVQA